MNQAFKQRLVGASVIVALAIIFLPSLLEQRPKVVMSSDSEIPPPPAIEPVEFAPSQIARQSSQLEQFSKQAQTQALFQPPLTTTAQGNIDELATEKSKEPSRQPLVVEELNLDDDLSLDEAFNVTKKIEHDDGVAFSLTGVPKGWVVKVASFESKKRADSLMQRLLSAGLRAYSKQFTTQQQVYERVFVGPFISKKDALTTKQQVDTEYNVASQVLRFNPAAGD